MTATRPPPRCNRVAAGTDAALILRQDRVDDVSTTTDADALRTTRVAT